MYVDIYAYKICAYHRREVERETLNKQDAGECKDYSRAPSSLYCEHKHLDEQGEDGSYGH